MDAKTIIRPVVEALERRWQTKLERVTAARWRNTATGAPVFLKVCPKPQTMRPPVVHFFKLDGVDAQSEPGAVFVGVTIFEDVLAVRIIPGEIARNYGGTSGIVTTRSLPGGEYVGDDPVESFTIPNR